MGAGRHCFTIGIEVPFCTGTLHPTTVQLDRTRWAG